MNWWYVLQGCIIGWPPVLVVAWLGKRRLRAEADRQTGQFREITEEQTEHLSGRTNEHGR